MPKLQSNGRGSLEGVLLAAASFLLWRLLQTHRQSKKYLKAYWSERRGRTRVEREIKKLSDIRLNTAEGFFVQPIGEVSSCYRQCVGTPRQGLLVPASRAAITLNTLISPESLVGLEEFSHVWITFKFHLNTNTLKESKAFANGSTFNAKITLPMLKTKLGVFATRSPHRPNPIGITLARIERVDKAQRRVFLSACDLVQGTPVYDIKPYVPAYDAVSPSSVPQWIAESVFTRNSVTIQPHCYEQVNKLQSKLKQYKNDPNAYMQGLQETLEAEVRSKFQTQRRIQDSTESGRYVEVPFDETMVKYLWLGDREFEVIDVEYFRDSAFVREQQQLTVGAANDSIRSGGTGNGNSSPSSSNIVSESNSSSSSSGGNQQHEDESQQLPTIAELEVGVITGDGSVLQYELHEQI